MRKTSCSGGGVGRVFCTSPELNLKQNNIVPLELVVLLRSTIHHIKPGVT